MYIEDTQVHHNKQLHYFNICSKTKIAFLAKNSICLRWKDC